MCDIQEHGGNILHLFPIAYNNDTFVILGSISNRQSLFRDRDWYSFGGYTVGSMIDDDNGFDKRLYFSIKAINEKGENYNKNTSVISIGY